MTEEEAEVLAAMQAAQRELRRVLKTGRYSPGLLFELTQQTLDGLNIGPIIDEIRHLEDTTVESRTRKARQFKRDILKGLWYKHYFQAQFLVQNLLPEQNGNRLKELLRPHAKRDGGKFITLSSNVIDEIAQEAVPGAFHRKAARKDLTGEYIVFEKSVTGHHYLTLGKHGEDEAILARVQRCRQLDAEVNGARGVVARIQLVAPQAGPE